MRPRTETPLYAALEAADLSVTDVAEGLGVSRVFAHMMLSGHAVVPGRHVEPLAELLRLRVDEVEAGGRQAVPLTARTVVRSRGMTTQQVADLVGISPARVMVGLNGTRPMPARALERLAEVVGIPAGVLALPDLSGLDVEVDR